MAYEIDKLRSLYLKYDTLSASGDDVVADLRKEINNLELAYLKNQVFPQVAQFMASKIKNLRCRIDSSLQFDGERGFNYSFCTSESMLFVKNSIDIYSTADIPQQVITPLFVEQSVIANQTIRTSALATAGSVTSVPTQRQDLRKLPKYLTNLDLG